MERLVSPKPVRATAEVHDEPFVVVAVVAVLGLLRFRRTSLLMWAGAWWVGIYVLLRFGFTAPIPASVVTLYMGIVSLAIVAYVTSTQERRDEVSSALIQFMTEKRYTPLLVAAVVAHPCARGSERLRQDERAAAASPLFEDGPSGVAVRDHGARQEDRSRCRRESVPEAADVQSRRVPHARGERAQGLLPELRLLPRRRPVGQRHVRRTGSIRSRPTSPTDRLPACATRSCSGGFPRAGRDFPRKAGPGTRRCPPGRRS